MISDLKLVDIPALVSIILNSLVVAELYRHSRFFSSQKWCRAGKPTIRSGKVFQTSEESSGSLFAKGGEALQEHTLQLTLHDMQIQTAHAFAEIEDPCRHVLESCIPTIIVHVSGIVRPPPARSVP